MRRLRILGSLLGEFVRFMNRDKLWWMTPLVVLLLAVSAFVILVEGSALAPLIYAMF